jgi:hypothetical protein
MPPPSPEHRLYSVSAWRQRFLFTALGLRWQECANAEDLAVASRARVPATCPVVT